VTQKENLINFKGTEIIENMFYDHNKIKRENNNKIISEESLDTIKLNKSLLNNQ
jgi:hypothetical protein